MTSPAPKHPEVAKLLADLYFDKDAARAILLTIGLPPNLIPGNFEHPISFWSNVVLQLDMGLGLKNGLQALVDAAAGQFVGNDDILALQAKLKAELTGRPMVQVPPQDIRADVPTPTLSLVGADLSEEFLEAIRQELGLAADLLYVSRQQCAVAIPDPGDDASRLRQLLQERMQALVPGGRIDVAYHRHEFRPYLLSQLTVYGPDTTPYLAEAVPSTTLAGDIAAALVQQIPGMANNRGGTVSTVIDAETEDGPVRLDPDKTLHENKVTEKSRLRVGAKAIAGQLSPEMRMQAQVRMRAQIRRYVHSHQDTFRIEAQDDESLPNRITFTLNGPGLAPPPNLDTFLAGTHNLRIEDFRALPWGQLQPVPIEFHRFTLSLPPMFPVIAPVAVWNSPVFHPNIWREPVPGAQPGMVCLGPLMDGYRPDLDFGYLCQLLVDIGTYRNYDVVDAPTYPDPAAALWARTESGQQLIQSIGGPPMHHDDEQHADRVRPALWLTTLAGRIAGARPGDEQA